MRGGATLDAPAAKALGRIEGLGFDQLMAIGEARRPGGPPTVAIFNTDGSRAGACGNGTRCVAWFLLEGGAEEQVVVETDAGLLACERIGPLTFTVDMGPPALGWHAIPLRDAVEDTRAFALHPHAAWMDALGPASAVSMGNPHAVFWLAADAPVPDLPHLGPALGTPPDVSRARQRLLRARARAGCDRPRRVGAGRGHHASLRLGRLRDAGLGGPHRTDRAKRKRAPARRHAGHRLAGERRPRADERPRGTRTSRAARPRGPPRDTGESGGDRRARAVEVLTFGCRLNIVESDRMRHLAESGGHRDLAIVNTCAVTAEATRQARQAIRRLRRDRPGITIAATGCAAAIDPAGFRAMPEVDRVIDNAAKTDPATWGAPLRMPEARDAAHTRGFVEVQNGCDHRCTFCVIPFGRGASRSVPPARVMERIAALVSEGVREVVLTGVDVNLLRRRPRGSPPAGCPGARHPRRGPGARPTAPVLARLHRGRPIAGRGRGPRATADAPSAPVAAIGFRSDPQTD